MTMDLQEMTRWTNKNMHINAKTYDSYTHYDQHMVPYMYFQTLVISGPLVREDMDWAQVENLSNHTLEIHSSANACVSEGKNISWSQYSHGRA